MTRPDIDTAALIAEVEQLLVLAARHRESMGAVNWADLKVLDVQRRQSIIYDDTAFICVIVEEVLADLPTGRVAS